MFDKLQALAHQTDTVVIGLRRDEILVLLELVVCQGDDGVIARGHRFFQCVVLEAGDIALDIRLAGDDLIALLGQDIGEQHRRALAGVVDVRLEAHAEDGDLGAGLDVAADALGHPFGLGVVDVAGFGDEGRDVFKFFVDEPRIDRDAVSADADAGDMDVDTGMAVGKLDEVENVDAEAVADLAEL